MTNLKNGVVNQLGSLLIHNGEGQGDSEAKNITIEFDTENTGNIKVTTINLPADNYTEYFEITYTLVDNDGNQVTIDGFSEWKYSLKNSYYEKTNLSNLYNRLYRSMLPEEQQEYYFKTISYTISTIRAGAYLYNTRKYEFNDKWWCIFWIYR